jgi:hypothetical protein
VREGKSLLADIDDDTGVYDFHENCTLTLKTDVVESRLHIESADIDQRKQMIRTINYKRTDKITASGALSNLALGLPVLRRPWEGNALSMLQTLPAKLKMTLCTEECKCQYRHYNLLPYRYARALYEYYVSVCCYRYVRDNAPQPESASDICYVPHTNLNKKRFPKCIDSGVHANAVSYKLPTNWEHPFFSIQPLARRVACHLQRCCDDNNGYLKKWSYVTNCGVEECINVLHIINT